MRADPEKALRNIGQSMKILLISPKMEEPNGGIAVWTNEYFRVCRGANRVAVDANPFLKKNSRYSFNVPAVFYVFYCFF